MSTVRGDGARPEEDEVIDHNDEETSAGPVPPRPRRGTAAGDASARTGPRANARARGPVPPSEPGEHHEAEPPRSEPDAATPDALEDVRPQTCVMIGPARSGKTTLLAAIRRACEQPSEDGLNLEFVSGASTAQLISTAIDKIINRGRGFDATLDVLNHEFEVHLTAKGAHFWSPPVEASLHVMMNDSGGGYLLPAGEIRQAKDYRSEVISEARRANSMILCVDATRPGVILLEKELAVAFSEITTRREVPTPIHWKERLWNKLNRRPSPSERNRVRRCLNAGRFLLLLTQVDKLCYQLPPHITRTIRFAEMIDPVEQARSLLGITLLKMIRSALKPSATFAVGISSAYGFNPLTGNPFADTDGTPINLGSAESGEEILRRWTPYGIRDAIYFLTTGEARGTVKPVLPEDLTPGPEPIEFVYSNGHRKEV